MVPAGVREHPAHPFGGADVRWTSATAPPHLPRGERGSRFAIAVYGLTDQTQDSVANALPGFTLWT
ncbi:MAG: hypothetical protein A3E57_02295 [Candidatus Muproteobacteria bacterium RIFCSPHIGHO2_12_FULL_60_33]|uniref:Uncharacterized protein n=1 Tax=Candidatus Muproteobacteria bacterium RIFCSPLOWO2_01_FULL_60_18 TaxID=1817768 RepID=A0A1F6U5J9_9PROT|nr:MAG: hypothetical protein A3A87_09200 [Candidatus Muproteobacteria bacterium RIFCSPLOWO2_01_FULL_60_18]OGI55257.1 MAG: hypothetical protein A3D32_02460 [Candidatus Muproteobacteria bacterium RIFCSPHIGHO2_02_FULL_60_13]OGI56418.1 MAG: hypothetical protein A3E57_02295 [Candidatus Muproteobacteria bacterium RIFCSPHIGHO2_12_FULL_60_33]